MQILNIFLFINLLNYIKLFNSFYLLNNKYCKNVNSFLKEFKYNKINMGCDYYIDKDLYIYDYDENVFTKVNLEHNKGYFSYYSFLDEDEEGYENEYKEYVKSILEPSMDPILIYNNNSFTKLAFEIKYEKLIDYHLQICNVSWNDVLKIVKVENRYER